MKRADKAEMVEELKSQFTKASITLLTDYQGLKVNDMNQLRRKLQETEARLQVVKNTLAKRAVEGTELKPLQEHFTGTLAVITGGGDPVASAKVLIQFAKEREKPKIKIGFMSGELMKASQIEALSKLPSREEMLSKLLGSMQAPAQNLVNVLVALPRQLVTVLSAIRDKKS